MSWISNLFKKTDYVALEKEGAIILDVRSKSEFASGHIKGAMNIDLNALDGQIDRIKKMDKPVITCCVSGMRSGSAKGKLKRAGVEAYNGGGWTSLQDKLGK